MSLASQIKRQTVEQIFPGNTGNWQKADSVAAPCIFMCLLGHFFYFGMSPVEIAYSGLSVHLLNGSSLCF
jgi:hypothetical protein